MRNELNTETQRQCNDCKAVLPLEQFESDRTRKYDKAYTCKSCRAIANGKPHRLETARKSYHKRTPEQKRSQHFRYKYNITLEGYDIMFEKQNGVCGICGLPQIGKRLAVDHSHSTGEIRGLLCDMCNKGLGLFYDNTENLKKAIEYMERSSE